MSGRDVELISGLSGAVDNTSELHVYHNYTLNNSTTTSGNNAIDSSHQKNASTSSCGDAADQPATLHIRPFSEWQWHRVHFTQDPEAPAQSTLKPVAKPRGDDEYEDDSDADSEKTVGDGNAIKVYDVPTSSSGPQYFSGKPQDGNKRLLIIMVGLPARGKTFLAQKLCRLLNWNGHRAQVVNVQVLWKERMKKRQHRSSTIHSNNVSGPFGVSGDLPSPVMTPPAGRSLGEDVLFPTGSNDCGFAFTGNNNININNNNSNMNSGVCSSAPQTPSAKACNRRVALAGTFESFLTDPSSTERRMYIEALHSYAKVAKDFYDDGGLVTIVNDDFPTASLRDDVEAAFRPYADSVIYIEVQRDPESNTVFDVLKVQDPDEYNPRSGMSQTEALADFLRRVGHMQRVYETMTPQSGKSYIKLMNSSVLEAHRVHGFLPSRIVSFLMNLSQMKISHPIYFCRHGQSKYNIDERLGGDPELTEKGRNDAEALYEFIASLKADLESREEKGQQLHGILQPILIGSSMSTYNNINISSNNNNNNNTSNNEGKAPPHTTSTPPHGTDSSKTAQNHMDPYNSHEVPSPPQTSLLNGETRRASSPQHDQLPGSDVILGASAGCVDDTMYTPPTTPRVDRSQYNNNEQNGEGRASVTILPHTAASIGALATAPPTAGLPIGWVPKPALISHEMQIWTSQLRRAMQTAAPAEKRLGIKALRWSSLNEIHAGVCEGMTYTEVKEEFPLIHRFRGENKYTFRYPQGESYQDLVARLEPVITELENANRVIVVVAHQAVLRGLLAYFGSTSAQTCVNVEVPHRTVWRCTYNAKGIAQIDSLRLGKVSAGDGKQD